MDRPPDRPLDLRHACLACGGSCRGARVALLPEEIAPIEAIGRRLGVERPVVDGRLRHVDDTCVFAAPDGLCTIHREEGFAAKPEICRQYPLVALKVDGVRRVGVDPGCYTAWSTWRSGPALDPGPLLLTATSQDPGLVRLETMLIELLDQHGWPGLVAGLTRPGFPARFTAALRRLGLRGLLERPGISRDLRLHLAPLLDWLDRPDPSAPFPTLDPDTNAWANEVIRRMIHLRLASAVPTPAAVALLVSGGVLVLAQVDPDPARFGPALAAWVRIVRTAPVWGGLVPSPEALKALAHG